MEMAGKVAPSSRSNRGGRAKALRVIAVLLMLAVGGGILVLTMSNEEASNRDYFEYWAVGHQLIHHQNPYDSKAIVRLIDPTEKRKNMVLRNPPYALFITLPLGFFSLKTGAVLWSLLLIGALMGSIRNLRSMELNQSKHLHLIGYIFPPALACLLAGQIGLFLLFGFTLFLRFHRSRPYLAGAALLICALKPHLFLPFIIALLCWVLVEKAFEVLWGAVVALVASIILMYAVDPAIWSQYIGGERGEKIPNLFIPCFSGLLRLATNRNAFWIQFVPELVGCAWAVWYFSKNKYRWRWKEHGPVLVMVSVFVAPYAWFTDESLLLPAIMAGFYRPSTSKVSIDALGLLVGVALLEVLAGVPLASGYYIWTAPGWLLWYVFATSRPGAGEASCREHPTSGETQIQEI